MRYAIISCIGYLLFSGSACLAQMSAADAAYEYRQRDMEDTMRRAREQARAIDEQEAAQARAEAEWRREMREQEYLRLEAEKLREMQRQGSEIEGLRGDIRRQERALKDLEMRIPQPWE